MIALGGNAAGASASRVCSVLVGLHGIALQDLARLPTADAEADSVPAWTEVTGPFCRFDQEQLMKLVDEPGLHQLVHQLAFEMQSCYLIERWNLTAGRRAARECPQAYGVYTEMANTTPMLGQREAVRSPPKCSAVSCP